MERREDSFYTAYSYGDKLEEGHKLTLEHHISLINAMPTCPR